MKYFTNCNGNALPTFTGTSVNFGMIGLSFNAHSWSDSLFTASLIARDTSGSTSCLIFIRFAVKGAVVVIY